MAKVYVQWATDIKLIFDLDPIKELLRQQRCKELADEALAVLKSCTVQNSHRWYYFMAEYHFLKWEYEDANRRIAQAITALPEESYLRRPYERLREQIIKKWNLYKRRR